MQGVRPMSADQPKQNQRQLGARDAYHAACRIVDRDHEAGVDDHGIIDNMLAELAKLAGVQ
jgi:hypothetical protein